MAIGIAAWGLVAGVAMAKSGMGVPLAIFMSVVVYAGSAQIAALPLIAAGAPMWVVWATTLCVSLRFMAFSFHYRPYFAHLPRRRRVALGFLMGDTNFALFIRRFPEPVPGHEHEDYFLGSALVTFGVWQVSIITGILAGDVIPASWGLGFAGTMALLALTCTQLRDRSTWVAGRGGRLRRGRRVRAAPEAEHRRRDRGCGRGRRAGRPCACALVQEPSHEPAGDLPDRARHGLDHPGVPRRSFLLPKQDLPMPRWLREGLRYAPTAALAAVVAPELVMTQGHLIDTWRDARIFGALAGLAFYAWRPSLFGTIVVRHRCHAGIAVRTGVVGRRQAGCSREVDSRLAGQAEPSAGACSPSRTGRRRMLNQPAPSTPATATA